MLRKVEVRCLGGLEYVFTERECEIIEKYFDDDSNVYMNLVKLELKIRKEYEKCLLLD